MNVSRFFRGALRTSFLASALALAPLSQAQLVFNVSLNTTPLQAQPGAPFSFYFDLIDGAAEFNTTTVELSAFDFGGGSLSGVGSSVGGVSGDVFSGLTFSDTEGLNSFSQAFEAGNWVSFTMTITSSVTELTPDSFSFGLTDQFGAVLPMESYNDYGSDFLFSVSIGSGGTSVVSYGTDTATDYWQVLGYDPIDLDAPSVTPENPVSPVPEPSTYGLLAAISLLGLAVWRRRSAR